MAKFQIKLLTSTHSNTPTHGKVQFLETIVGEFNSDSPSTFSYTYNEKFSIHQNSQKELSFSMIDYYWNDDTYEKNPFINEISIGSQLLLIDNYNNEHIFTVKDIKYTFHKDNVEYSYTCQDSFSYQLTRQQSGYTIENSTEDADFIGAQDIDWWVENYIFPDCYIAYEYIPLAVGIYENEEGNLIKYREHDILNNVKKIIKKPYSINNPEDKELFEKFCFSVSDSSALSSLISLSEQIGMSIKTREQSIRVNQTRTTTYSLYCWFDPQYSNETTNLRYSPFSDIQSFSLSQSGNSITTILNVESNIINDEVISLIPSIPTFFSEVVNYAPFWNNSSYSDGMFTSLCSGMVRKSNNGIGDFDCSIDMRWEAGAQSFYDDKYVYILINGLDIPPFYQYVDFKNSYIIISGESDLITPETRKWYFSLISFDSLGNKIKETTYDNRQKLGQEFWDKNTCLFLKISHKLNTENTSRMLQSYNLTFRFHRQPSEEEKVFAKIADSCPWLESKIIDFSYFLKEKIITQSEYNSIWNELTNNLRKINGRLLVYSDFYQQSVKDKIEKIAKLQEKVDMLSAEFNHSVVESFKENGFVSDITDFNKKYTDLLAIYQQRQKTPILDLPILLTEYINNFDAAEQRFLKNLYDFKNYFYSSVGWENTALYQDRIIFDPIQREDVAGKTYKYLSFSPSQWTVLNDSFKDYDKETGEVFADIFNMDWKTRPSIVTKNNCKDYYLFNFQSSESFTELNEKNVFSTDEDYYEGVLKAERKIENERFTIVSLYFHNPGEIGEETTSYYDNTGVLKTADSAYSQFEIPVNQYAPIYIHYGWDDGSDIVPFYFKDSNNNLLFNKDGKLSFHGEWTKGKDQVAYLNAPKDAYTVVVQVSTKRGDAWEGAWSICGFLTKVREELKEKVENGETKSVPMYYYRLNGFTGNTLVRLKEKYKNKNFWDLTPEFISCSLADLYNRSIWREKVISDTNTYERNPITRVSLKTGDDKWPSSAPNWALKLVPYAFLASFSANDYDDESLNVFRTTSNSDSISDDVKWDFYKSHFPVENIYYKGPKIINSSYKVQDGDNKYVYNCQFANASDKTTSDYINYWKSINKTNSPEDLVEIINPHDSSQWPSQSIQIINKRNEANFFRRVISPTLTGDVEDITNMSQNTWSTSGTCDKNFFNESLSSSFTGFIENNNTIFTPSASAYDTYSEFNTPKIFINDVAYLEVDLKEFTTAPTSSTDTIYVKVASSEDNSKHLYSKLQQLPSDKQAGFYESYYGLIAPSYTLLTEKWNPQVGDFEYDASWLQPIASEDKINIKDKYRILVYSKQNDVHKIFPLFQDSDDGRETFKTIAKTRLNCVVDYLLTNNSVTIDFGSITNSDNSQDNILSAKQALFKLGWNVLSDSDAKIYFAKKEEGDHVYVAAYKDVVFVFGLYREEDYITQEVDIKSYYNTNSKCWLVSDIYQGQTLYNDKSININSILQDQIVGGFYKINVESTAYFPNTEGLWNPTKEYFKLNSDSTLQKYSRAYTIQQLISKGSYYYQGQSEFVYESLSPDLTSFDVKLYGHKEVYDDDGNLKTHEVISFIDYNLLKYSTDKEVELKKALSERKYTITKEYNDELYTGTYYFDGRVKENIGHLTKGEFYFKYKNSSQESLVEEAANIAAQLSQYWTVAYNASKFCSYFLPESWDVQDVTSNHFTDWIYNKKGGSVLLKNILIPEIEILTTNQPKYTFYHVNYNSKKLVKDTLIPLKEPYSSVLTRLGGDVKDFMLVEGIKGNRYKRISGGLQWKDLAKRANNSISVFPNFSGQYEMIFSLLNKLFSNKILTQYNELIKQKTEFWTGLYTKYPNILLEDSFKNEDALTSEDLYTLATYAFKDKSEPESSYQLSYINLDSLQGYCSNEIKIGDGILLDHEEFYHEIDEVSKALSQYLFITDISYNLRSDADISLTINKVKYQDKLIQRLVKLIK